GPGTAPTYLAPRNYNGWEVAANYRVWGGLRAFASVSTAASSAGTTKDFYGVPLKVPNAESPAPEIGIKFATDDNRYAAQLAYDLNTKVTNETRNAGSDFFRAVNPAGINGTYNSGDQWINLDRKASSLELTLTATPVKNWRFRLQATKPDGEITSTVSYKQLYNDQFYSSG